MVIFQSYVSLPEGGASLVDTIGGASLRPRQKKEATDVINPISGDGQPLPTKSQGYLGSSTVGSRGISIISDIPGAPLSKMNIQGSTSSVMCSLPPQRSFLVMWACLKIRYPRV